MTTPPAAGGATTPPSSLHFGGVELRLDERAVYVDGMRATLGARAFDLLADLVAHRDRTVTKAELLERVWPHVVVEENNLQVQVSTLRRLLGPRAIATIPGRGYRFTLAEAIGSRATAPTSPPGALAPATIGTATVTPPGDAPPTNLPPRLPPLLGREAELAALGERLEADRLVTVTGAGGMGKTRLAQALAQGLGERFPDGRWWVDLAVLADPALVAPTVAMVLGVTPDPLRGPVASLQSVLAQRRMLLVLDNCEHLLDGVAPLVEALLAHGAALRILATSQEPLRVAEEHTFRLGPLKLPEPGDRAADASGAVAMFVARAKSVDRRFALDEAASPIVVEICRRLDGIPLAIELAAARLPLLGLEGLRARLDERFRLLTGGSRTVLRRHQTLRATLDWSFGLLGDGERLVLRRLGVFPGRFDLEAARAVAGEDGEDDWSVIDALGGLVDRSLVLAEGGDEPLYRLLETTRAYALERLADAGETEAVLRSHAVALRDRLARIDARVHRLDEGERRAAAAELDDLRAALDWATHHDEALAIELAASSHAVWQGSTVLVEPIERLLPLAKRMNATTPAAVQARLWRTIARLGTISARAESFDAARRAAALFRALGDAEELCASLVALVAIGAERGLLDAAAAAAAEANGLDLERMPGKLRAGLRWAEGRLLLHQGRYEEALQAAFAQAAIYRAEGMLAWEAIALGANVAAAEHVLGRYAFAERHSREALVVIEANGMDRESGHVRTTLATALSLQGHHAEAIAEARRALPLLVVEGDDFRMLLPLALNAALAGRPADAARVAGYVDAHEPQDGRRLHQALRDRRARLDALLGEALPAAELEALRARGAALDHDAVFAVAFGDAPLPLSRPPS